MKQEEVYKRKKSLPEDKDEIRKHTDIVRLFESFGVKLTRKGDNYLGLCPWQ